MSRDSDYHGLFSRILILKDSIYGHLLNSLSLSVLPNGQPSIHFRSVIPLTLYGDVPSGQETVVALGR